MEACPRGLAQPPPLHPGLGAVGWRGVGAWAPDQSQQRVLVTCLCFSVSSFAQAASALDDTHLPPETLWWLERLGVDACIFQELRYLQTSPAIRITALWTSSYYQRHTLAVLGYTCRLFARPCEAAPESSLCFTPPQCGILWPARPATRARRPMELPAHLLQLFPLAA